MKKRLLTVSVLGAVLAFGAVGCGGDEDNAAQLNTWAKSVCDAAQDPIAQSRTAFSDTGKVQPGEAPGDLQKRLSGDLAVLAKSSEQFADAVDKAGAPKVTDGEKLRTDAVAELRQAAQGYQEAQKKLDALPVADQEKFADGLKSVGDQVQRLSQQSTRARNRLESGELGGAIKKQDGCKSTGTSGAPSSAPADPAAASTAPAASAASPSAG
ncbi:small secreted protein [Kitasatospora camelliae]|uniref:Small secreted protein n=1 Tax=Kitasatospora camelliae TaxID=3156397 RepID=A0AAU8JX73_9ACTN